jgi:predicted Zn-dependent peptidase
MLDERDFSGVVWNVCSDILAERQTAEGLAGQIGRGAVLCGQPDASDRLLARLRALTAPKVFPVAEKYFQPELLNFVVVHPGPLTRGEPPANVAKTSPPAAADAARARQVAIPADYPATPPLATDVIPFQVATAQEFEVDGLHVSLLPGISPGRMDLQFVLPRGAQNDPAGMDGLGRLTMNLVLAMAERPQRNPDVGTWTHFPLSYGSSHETDRTQVWIVSPSDQADHLMHEINDSMCWPLETGFFEDYLVYLKWRNFNTLKTEDQRGRPVADLDLRRSLFADSFLGRRINPASLRSISRAQLELCRTYLFDLHGATLIMSADLKVDQVKAMLAIMREGWPSPPRSWPAAPTMGTPGPEGGMRIVLVDDPEAHQSAIRIGARAFADGSDEAPAGDLAEWILNQRIWRVVRADQGYAYVVNSGFDQFRDGGMFAVRTETGIERTGQTTVELLNRIREIAQQEVTASELSDAKIAYTGRFVTGLRTAQEQAAWRAFARQRGEVDDVLRRIAQAQEVVPTQIRELFAKYARDDRLSMVIVGPAALVKPQVESLGPVEVRPMPALRPGAATRPAWQEIPRPM